MTEDKTFSIVRTLDYGGGRKETKLYEHCKFVSTKARCSCGFFRWTNKGFLNTKQIKDLQDHLKKRLGNHKITVSHSLESETPVPLPFEATIEWKP